MASSLSGIGAHGHGIQRYWQEIKSRHQAHDWEQKTPAAVLYQPFVSAYAAVHNISENLPSAMNLQDLP